MMDGWRLTCGQAWRAVQAQLTPLEPAPSEGKRLVAHVLGCAVADVLWREREGFPPQHEAPLAALVARRLNHEPLAYIVGYAPFWNHDWAVGAGVLIPRPDSEVLVEQVLRRVPRDQPCRLAEVGVGSGALLGSILHERPLATGVGTEVEPDALAYATHNLAIVGVTTRATLYHTRTLEGVTGPFEVIFSNPPYISAADYAALDHTVRGFEPASALLADNNGLAVYDALVPAAKPLLCPQGWLCVEIGHTQAAAVQALLSQHGYREVTVVPDLAGRARVVCGQVKAA